MNKLIWAITPLLYGVLGLVTGYLTDRDLIVPGTLAGIAGGFAVAYFALAGEKD